MLDNAQTAITGKQFASAGDWVSQAQSLGVRSSSVTKVNRDLTRAKERVAATSRPKPKPKPPPKKEPPKKEPPKVVAQAKPATTSPPAAAAITKPAPEEALVVAKADTQNSGTTGQGVASGGSNSATPDTTPEPQKTGDTAPPEPPVANNGIAPLSNFEFRRYVAPKYPRIAKQYGRAGWVELEFTINEVGETESIEVLASKPNTMFNRSAISAVKRWTFEPPAASVNNVANRTRVRLNFTQ